MSKSLEDFWNNNIGFLVRVHCDIYVKNREVGNGFKVLLSSSSVSLLLKVGQEEEKAGGDEGVCRGK